MFKFILSILFSSCLTIFCAQKNIIIDSIKEFKFCEIHYSKDSLALYDKLNRNYILPYDTKCIQKLDNDYFGKTFLIDDNIIVFNELKWGHIIIKNSLEPYSILVAVRDKFGKLVDADQDGIEDYYDKTVEGYYKSGIYDVNTTNWILEPNFYSIDHFDSVYLIRKYNENGKRISYISNINLEHYNPIFQTVKDEKNDLKLLFKADSISQLDRHLFFLHSKKKVKIIFFENYWNLFVSNEKKYDLFEYEHFNNSNDTKTFISKIDNNFYLHYFNLKSKEETYEKLIYDSYIKKYSKSYYLDQYNEIKFSESDSLVQPFQILDDLNSQRHVVSFGKIKLNDQHTVIINYKNCYSILEPVFDSNGDNADYDNNGIEDYQVALVKGVYKSGLFNTNSNDWIFQPKYEKIIKTNSGYTTILRSDTLINEIHHEMRIYSFYDNEFKLLSQQSDLNDSYYKNPKNFNTLFYNADFYTLLFEANKFFDTKEYEKALKLYIKACPMNSINVFCKERIIETQNILK